MSNMLAVRCIVHSRRRVVRTYTSRSRTTPALARERQWAWDIHISTAATPEEIAKEERTELVPRDTAVGINYLAEVLEIKCRLRARIRTSNSRRRRSLKSKASQSDNS